MSRQLQKKIDCTAVFHRYMKDAAGIVSRLGIDGIERKICAVQVGTPPVWQALSRKHVVSQMNRIHPGLKLTWETKFLEKDTTMNEVLATIAAVNADEKVCGVVIERPGVPKHLSIKVLQQAVHPIKDIEGMHPESIGKVVYGGTKHSILSPCTARASVEVLRQGLGGTLEGLEVVVVGNSNVLAKPIVSILHGEGSTVTVCPAWVPNLAAYTRSADCVVSSVNQGAGFLTGDMLKPGSILIDLGINIDDDGGFLGGDANVASCLSTISKYSSLVQGIGIVRSAVMCGNIAVSLKTQLGR